VNFGIVGLFQTRAITLKKHKTALALLDDDKKSGVHTKDPRWSIASNHSGFRVLALQPGLKIQEPSAKNFKRWVTRDVVPTIRKAGAYMNDDTIAKIGRDSWN